MSDAEQDSVTISRKVLDELRARASLVQVLVEDFVNDGRGDVHGPHLAEPEVWARLKELEGLAERLEGTEPLTDEEIRALLVCSGGSPDHPLFDVTVAEMKRLCESARAKLRARLAREDAE